MLFLFSCEKRILFFFFNSGVTTWTSRGFFSVKVCVFLLSNGFFLLWSMGYLIILLVRKNGTFLYC